MERNEKLDKTENGIEIRLMQPQDAPGVVGLYTAVYGNEYPVKTVYDTEALIRDQQTGEMYRIIAVSEGRVVGQTAVYRSTSTNPDLYEEGQGIVLPEYRNQGILERCMGRGHQEIYPGLNIKQMWGEAVCNHVFMQKAGARIGSFETGIEIDLMPASSYAKEQSSQGRVAALLMFKNFQKATSQTIYMPEPYQDSLPYLYSVHDFGHQFISSQSPLPDQKTRLHREIYEGAGVARFTLLETGKDLEKSLLEHEKEALLKGCTIFQVYLNLASPAVNCTVGILRDNQYFLGGFLPCWFRTDGLLMQKTLHEPYLEGIKLYSDHARSILDIIVEDRKAVTN